MAGCPLDVLENWPCGAQRCGTLGECDRREDSFFFSSLCRRGKVDFFLYNDFFFACSISSQLLAATKTALRTNSMRLSFAHSLYDVLHSSMETVCSKNYLWLKLKSGYFGELPTRMKQYGIMFTTKDFFKRVCYLGICLFTIRIQSHMKRMWNKNVNVKNRNC